MKREYTLEFFKPRRLVVLEFLKHGQLPSFELLKHLIESESGSDEEDPKNSFVVSVITSCWSNVNAIYS